MNDNAKVYFIILATTFTYENCHHLMPIDFRNKLQ
jgi:hypothetical protein